MAGNKKSKKSSAPTAIVVYGPQPKPKPKAKAKGKGGGARKGNSMAVRAICGLTDPFCGASIGTKWPDASSTPTLAYRKDTIYSLQTSAAGESFVAISPTPFFDFLPYASIASGVVTWGAAYQTLDSAAASVIGASNYRLVSVGVEIIPICPSMTNSGYLITCEASAPPAPGSTWTTTAVSTSNRVLVSNFRGSEGVSYIFRPGGPDAYSFKDGAALTATAGQTTCGWTGLRIGIVAATASQYQVTLRVRANYEYEPAETSGFRPSTKPPNTNLALTNVVARTRDALEPLTKGLADRVEGIVARTAAGILNRAGGAAMGYMLAGPLGAVAGASRGMIMDID